MLDSGIHICIVVQSKDKDYFPEYRNSIPAFQEYPGLEMAYSDSLYQRF